MRNMLFFVPHLCAKRNYAGVISRRGDVRDGTSGTTYSLQAVSFFLSFFIYFYSSSNLSCYSSDLRDNFTKHVQCLGISNTFVRFQICYVLFLQDAKNRKKLHFHLFSLGDRTFSTTAQKRVELGENRKQPNHLRLITFHLISNL